MSFEINNKIALVTGGNRGIGKSIVESLLDKGVSKVYVAVRNTATVEPLAKQYGDKVVAIEMDLSRPETITAAAKKATDVELLVNSAGILENATPLSANAVDALRKEIDVNVIGLINIAQAFAPILKQNGGGALVQLNSIASMKNFADFATYSASKAAAYSITQALRDKLEEQGTQVVSVHPGPIDTDMANNAGLGEIAEPPSLVADGIIAALKSGEFHAFPDTMAKQIGEQYKNFATNIVEVNLMEG